MSTIRASVRLGMISPSTASETREFFFQPLCFLKQTNQKKKKLQTITPLWQKILWCGIHPSSELEGFITFLLSPWELPDWKQPPNRPDASFSQTYLMTGGSEIWLLNRRVFTPASDLCFVASSSSEELFNQLLPLPTILLPSLPSQALL